MDYSKSMYMASLWQNLMARVYGTNIKRPAYRNCHVGKRWMDIRNFITDIEAMKNHHTEGFYLDKDLRLLGNKVYSVDYCSFVPAIINTCLQENRATGVRITPQNNFVARMRMYNERVTLGTFPTFEEAYSKRNEAKLAYIRKLAKTYKRDIHQDVYDNLTNLTVKDLVAIEKART